MSKTVLIANRGEIASRIIKTCKKLNFKTIAIYSEADKNTKFVREADKAFLVGKANIQDSYLQKEKIIELALKEKVDAIHPGYGLLSEDYTFAKLCEKNDIIFIGPKAKIIQLMANKVEARSFMEKIGVPIIPGSKQAITKEEIKDGKLQLTYPLMLKAASGGGGLGLNIVHNKEELLNIFSEQEKRAKTFFNDDHLYIEKYIPDAKHIEIQVARDKFGNGIHLFERECSIQRRRQKVIEEAPCSFISKNTKEKLFAYSLKAIKAMNYTNVGTIEFLVDKDENIYFLEMNTRIQVEHPVTEMITDLDLVQLQFDIAFGKKLQLTNENISKKGHAIEVRIYAENPKTFFPSPGKINKMFLPTNENIRYDFFAEENLQITPFYDPLIGKIISYGKTREKSRKLLINTLQQIQIEGIETNIPMLIDTLKNPSFIDGSFNIHFVEQNN